MTVYLFKSIICLGILLLVYFLFLEKEKMHRFNRWYLLSSILFACLVPLISFEMKAETLPVLQNGYLEIIYTGSRTNNAPVQPVTGIPETKNYLPYILLFLYTSVAFALLFRFGKNMYRLLISTVKNKTVMYRGVRLVLLKERMASHSFLNNIFMSEEDYEKHRIEEEIFTHELAHVKEKHSLDIIFIELMQSIFWFNPLFLLYKKAIQLNHEYLADDAVIRTCGNVPAYQYLLLEKVSLASNLSLTSSFNYSITKKRLIMMTKKYNNTSVLLKKLFILPVLAGAVFIFSSKTILAQTDKKTAQQKKETLDKVREERPEVEEVFVLTRGTPFTAEGVSAEVFKEYKTMEEKYIDPNISGHIKYNDMPERDRDRMETIFKQMSRDQQSQTNIIFMPPLQPAKKNQPTQEQLDKWKDGKIYGVWIDPKKIKNEALNNYKASDFSNYFVSKLYPNARTNVSYFYQVNLETNAEFERSNKARRENKKFTMAFISRKQR